MPQVQTIYNGNYIVWQRKLAEITIDLKSDLINLQQFGLTIAESDFFNFTLAKGIYLFVDVAATASPNVWTNVYSGRVMDGAGWQQDAANQAADSLGNWQENTYVFDRGISVIGRYVRFRLAADSSFTPLQTVVIKKVLIRNHQGISLTANAAPQTNALGWQTGEVLKDIMEDLLENKVLLSTTTEELEGARVSPKGTWNSAAEIYGAPAPRMFASLVERLNDLEKDAERRLTARKVVIPVEDNILVMAGTSEITTNLNADSPYKKIRQYVSADDTVDVLIQLQEGVGDFEEPLRDSGVLVYGKVTYGLGTTGYVANQNAKVTLYRSSDNSVYVMSASRTLKLVVPVETDLYHMDKYDLTRTTFSTGVIQDIGVLNDIDAIQTEIRNTLTSDTVGHKLVVYESAGLYFADLVFDSNAAAGTGWQVSKNGVSALPGMDFTFVTSQKIRLDTHDNNLPTSWSIQYFTKDKTTLDSKINEIIEAVARLTVSILAMSSNIDEINDALAVEVRNELLQFDYSSSDGYEYFKPLTYVVSNVDNTSAVVYKNGVSIGAKDSVWAFRGDGVVALFRSLAPYSRDAEYSIRYYSHKYERLNEKLTHMVKTTDRDLIVKNWKITNPVPASVESDGLKLI